MRIQSVQIKNFRSLKNVSIPFDSVTTFIGPNGAGKSTILRALDWFFNGKTGALNEKDCSFGAKDEEIEVQVTFSGLTEPDRTALGKYAPANAETFTAWKKRGPDNSESMSANAKSYPPFNLIRSKISAADKKIEYNTLRISDPKLELPAWTNLDAANQAMTAWEAAHTKNLLEAPEFLQTNFFGFNSVGKMSGLFDFVLITADLRAGEESIDGKSSIIGRILEHSVSRGDADAEIAVVVEKSRAEQQRIYEEKFKDKLDSMTQKLNQVLTSYSSGRTITVSPAYVELKAPRTTFEVAVMDGETETSVELQGHGFQRALLISALQHLAQSSPAYKEGVICFAIEEPELFQHPIQAQAFAKVLRSLANDEKKKVQVTYATHSPYFLEAQHFHQVRRLTRSSDENPSVSVHWGTIEDVKTKLAGIIEADQVERQLDGIATERLSIALFASRVLLVEGETEAAVFYGIGDREAVGCLESQGLAIVSAGGKGGIPLAHAILTSLGIPTYSLFDGDNGFEKRAIAAGKKADIIAGERNKFSKENSLLLNYFKEPIVEFPAEKICHQVATLNDHLETYLELSWIEWNESYRFIEIASGMQLKKNQYAYRAATREAKGTVPDFLRQVLSKAIGK